MKKLLMTLLVFLLIGCQEKVAVVLDGTPYDLPEQVLVEDRKAYIELKKSGESLDSFIPDGWLLKDQITLDYNNDGYVDYVAVIEIDHKDYTVLDDDIPRVLFALINEKDHFELDFQEDYLIRTRHQGGVHGDPYLKMTYEDSTFTTHAYGGSSWRWSEDNTYEYIDGIWYLMDSKDTYGYMTYITHYTHFDYKNHVLTKGFNRDDILDGKEDPYDFDLTYQLPLGQALTLKESGTRSFLKAWYQGPIEVNNLYISQDLVHKHHSLEVSQAGKTFNRYSEYLDYCIYDFKVENEDFVAVYDKRSGDSTVVLANENPFLTSAFDSYWLDGHKLYYVLRTFDVEDNEDGYIDTGSQVHVVNVDGSASKQVYDIAGSYNYTIEDLLIVIYNRDGLEVHYSIDMITGEVNKLGQVRSF